MGSSFISGSVVELVGLDVDVSSAGDEQLDLGQNAAIRGLEHGEFIFRGGVLRAQPKDRTTVFQ